MAKTGLDLISMADIARLAGQSRATVGNWKARNPDFPPERDRGPRGPLYDRTEVTRWLESTGRLDKRPHEVEVMWRVVDGLRADMQTEEALTLVLLLLAVMSKSSSADWQTILGTPPQDLDKALRSKALVLFPFADQLMPRGRLRPESLAWIIQLLSQFDRSHVPLMADALLEQPAKAMGYRTGEYLTPPSVRRLVVAIAQPTGTVYNPASGIGQLMIDAAVSAGSRRCRALWSGDQPACLGDGPAEPSYPRRARRACIGRRLRRRPLPGTTSRSNSCGAPVEPETVDR